ncbi:hypothetical protein ACFWF7_08600 [Nocardia sp. NPDC060256]|uniref:hypothetical protein n=1 Tax=unclassified Nocardia TaxID=2637762 RepID=UPI00364C7CD5
MTEQMTPPVETIPFSGTCPFSPPPQYQQMLADELVSQVRLPNDTEIWALASYADVRGVLTDARFSSDNRHPGYPTFSLEKPTDQPLQTMINLDAQEHSAARRQVIGEYTAKRIKDLPPHVQRIVDEPRRRASHRTTTGRPGGGFRSAGASAGDVHPARSPPLRPSVLLVHQREAGQHQHPRKRDEAFGALGGYLWNLIEKKEKEPGDDLLSRQIAKNRELSGPYRRCSHLRHQSHGLGSRESFRYIDSIVWESEHHSRSIPPASRSRQSHVMSRCDEWTGADRDYICLTTKTHKAVSSALLIIGIC